MNHVVYCWESGNSLLPLARISAEMAAQGHRVTCVMREITRAAELLEPHKVQWLSAPQWKSAPSPVPPLNHAELLMRMGYDAPDHLHGLIGAWRQAFELLRPDRVVCDAAPSAMLAASSLDIPVLCVDNGFFMPPVSAPLPKLREDAPDASDRLLASERAALDVINQVMQRLRRPAFARLADVYLHSVWYRNWVEFSHFGKHSADRHVGQIHTNGIGAAVPRWPAGEGPKLFCYLKIGHPQSMNVLEQASQLGYRVLTYLPGFSTDFLEKLRRSGRVAVSDAPINLSALDDDIEIGIWPGATEAFARCLDKGMRTLFLPVSAEDQLSCRALQRAGVPVQIANVGEENWPRMFAQIQALPRYRLGERFKPADTALLAQRLATGDA